MRLVFVTEARFIKNNEGKIYGDSSFNYMLWQRYLTVFSEVNVMARVQYIADYRENQNLLSSGDSVSFIELSYFVGPLQYIQKLRNLKSTIKQSITAFSSSEAVFICRIPGNISNIVIKYLHKKNIPFGVEVVGDPWDVFAPGSINHPLQSYFRWKGYFDLKKNVDLASAALYVTKETLQKRYPVSKNIFQTAASDVRLKNDLILDKAKIHPGKKQFTILSVGTLEQMYKSPDILLRAIKILNDRGVSCNLIWLGGGVYKEEMENLALELEITHLVVFKGNVNADVVRENMLSADIFVLASRTEGLPRVIIEAMSTSLPCVGTNVGGIPELLEQEMLVPKNDSEALAEKIEDLIGNEKLYNTQAERNLIEVQKYSETILTEKRMSFYKHLIDLNK